MRMRLLISALLTALAVACMPGATDPEGLEDAGSGDASQPGSDAAGIDVPPGTDAHQPGSDAAGVDVPPGSDAGSTGNDAGTTGNDAGTPPVGSELNTAWIGGACGDANDCSDVTDAVCETSGFPNGMCTVDCATYCPDAPGGYGGSTGATVTRCIVDDVGQGRCVGGCDFGQSDTGCRPGYACVLRQRDGQPDSIFAVCLPADGQRWPGESAPADDVGDACTLDTECAHLACLENLPAGYCTKTMCNVAGCPDGSTCYGVSNSSETICIQDCTNASDCREDDGYTCDSDDTCWPSGDPPPPVDWDPSVGEPGCAAAWNGNMSPCDTSPDDYIVIHKSARNLALCNSGSLVNNYQVGISPAPNDVGDKVREGDGKTPEGIFYNAALVPNSSYYKAFLISYPDSADADRGLASSLISQSEHDAIDTAQDSCGVPPQTTDLGSYLEVHGQFPGYDWTLGCVSVTNANMDAMWAVIEETDTIVIHP